MGPAVGTYEKILQLLDAGMSVARINFSHGTQEEHHKVIENLKQAREEKQVPLAIMLDTKGPEIRVGKMRDDAVQYEAGSEVLLTADDVEGDEKKIPIGPEPVLKSLKEGMTVLFDDGYLVAKVIKKGPVIQMQNAGLLRTHKGVNVPGANILLPAMTEQDVKDIVFGCENDVDVIAGSFIRSAEHILEIKKLLAQKKKSDIFVIAKIENALGVQNFDEILNVADGIMVARGDLGVELPLREVPRLQKMMIRKCYQSFKPVVTATQMLESMIKYPRPTRAEVSDVANAIYDATSCAMLSGETAMGKYPIESAQMMGSIIEETEKDFPYRDFFERDGRIESKDVSVSVALAAVKTAYTSGAKAIFVFTSSGFTARLISRFRPQMPIVALTSSMKVYHQLSFSWGVYPVNPSPCKSVQEAFAIAGRFALEQGLVSPGDLVVITAGVPFGVSGSTNMMIVDRI